jgi:hypothetical protein
MGCLSHQGGDAAEGETMATKYTDTVAEVNKLMAHAHLLCDAELHIATLVWSAATARCSGDISAARAFLERAKCIQVPR